MTQVFNMEQLDERLDLSPAFAGKSDDPIGYFPESDMAFKGSFEAYLKVLKKRGEFQDVFKFCPITSRRMGHPCYAALADFKQTPTGWETSLSDAANADRRETYQAFRDKNLPFLRMYMMGNPELKITCPLTGQQIDAWEFAEGILINIWEQHHFKVRNRASVQKEADDPGEILRRMDFSEPSGETVEAIKDMMRTIFLSPTAHKAVHNTWNDSDIRNYPVSRRPWALQSLENWDDWMVFLEERGYSRALFGSHADWLKSLELTEADLAR